jgi:hypothetical protein
MFKTVVQYLTKDGSLYFYSPKEKCWYSLCRVNTLPDEVRDALTGICRGVEKLSNEELSALLDAIRV